VCSGEHRSVVVGIGNRFRRDDSVGLLVLDAVRSRLPTCATAFESNGDAVALVSTWEGADLAVLIDAVVSGGKPGTIYRFDGAHPLPIRFFRAASSHVLGLAEALELARALDRLPPRVLVIGIEADDVSMGDGLSAAAASALPRAADLVIRLLDDLHAADLPDQRGAQHA
jgi:hydrogenase maturation protease